MTERMSTSSFAHDVSRHALTAEQDRWLRLGLGLGRLMKQAADTVAQLVRTDSARPVPPMFPR